MAGIDKTYTKDYKEYKRFKDWADTQTITFYDGFKVCIGGWVWELDKEDFEEERPIMNTPTWLDTYLIQNCKVDFVLNRMKVCYGTTYDKLKSVDLTTLPEGFERNRNFKIEMDRDEMDRYNGEGIEYFPIHSKENRGTMFLTCSNDNEFDFWYNDETKKWGLMSKYPTNTNAVWIRGLKGVVRHLKKQYLPSGVKFNASGKWIGQYYTITAL